MLLDDRIAALSKSRQYEEIRVLCAEYCQAHPDDIDGWFRLGMIETHLQLPRQALASFQRIIAAGQALGEACFNIGRLYSSHGQLEQALGYYRRALSYRPDFAEACSTMAELLRRQGQYGEAQEYYQQAMQMQPDYNNLRIHIVRRYESDEEIDRATQQFQAMMHSNLLFLRSYHVLCGPEEMLAAHLEWDRIHGEEGRAHSYHFAARDGAEQRLRIGYVSPDFRRHAVSSFFEPILAAHDRSAVEVFCYAEVPTPDEVTERLRAQADGWCSTVGLSDAQVAQRIVDDGIDVLVDLSGHTANNRLKIFTYRPAPVQVTYLGYFTTTGLAAMDYWLSDNVLTPPDTVELASEAIYRLSRSCLVYQAPNDAPEVSERPEDGAVIFGSFNDLSKVAPEAVACWSEVLRRVPGSMLLVKARQLADEAERDKLRQRFAVHGVAAERLIFRSPTPGQAEHLAVFGEVDIALDSMPRTGGSTTAEALWMGVPVISLAGTRYVERLSATMLTAAGLGELIASTPAEYIDKAVALAADAPYRKKLRQGMRERLAASPLCDARGLAQALEEAFREMWVRRFPARP